MCLLKTPYLNTGNVTRTIKNAKVNVKVNPQATSAEITASAANQSPSSSINSAGDSPDPDSYRYI